MDRLTPEELRRSKDLSGGQFPDADAHVNKLAAAVLELARAVSGFGFQCPWCDWVLSTEKMDHSDRCPVPWANSLIQAAEADHG